MSTTMMQDSVFSSISQQDNGTYTVTIRDDWDQAVVYTRSDLPSFDSAKKQILLWSIGRTGKKLKKDMRFAKSRLQLAKLGV